MTNYWNGRSYAWQVNRFLYRDILHDAYIHWYNKTGKNLFDEPWKRVVRVIKLTYYGYYISQNIRNRQWFEFDDNLFNTVTPEQQLIDSESFETLIKQIQQTYPRSSNQMVQSLTLKLEGYQQKEIAEKLGVPKSLITYYFNNIRSMQIHNPFVGSKIIISKKISRKTLEANPEKYGAYKYDPDKDCDHNEWFELRVNSNGEYILIKEKDVTEIAE